jgi:hypothetical protein
MVFDNPESLPPARGEANNALFNDVLAEWRGARISPVPQSYVDDRVRSLIIGLRSEDYLTREDATESLRKGLSGQNQGKYLRALATHLNNPILLGEDKTHVAVILRTIALELNVPGQSYRDSIAQLNRISDVDQQPPTLKGQAQAAGAFFSSKPALELTAEQQKSIRETQRHLDQLAGLFGRTPEGTEFYRILKRRTQMPADSLEEVQRKTLDLTYACCKEQLFSNERPDGPGKIQFKGVADRLIEYMNHFPSFAVNGIPKNVNDQLSFILGWLEEAAAGSKDARREALRARALFERLGGKPLPIVNK